MKFSAFTFSLTSACNYNCAYCRQKKEKNSLDISVIDKTIAFVINHLSNKFTINFYGGEPLLEFGLIKHAVEGMQVKSRELNKECRYAISTNGSLINDDVADFLKKYNFDVLLSFDGLAQNISRKKGSQKDLILTTKRFLNISEISLMTNSVFTPSTVHLLSDSIQLILELGVSDIDISISYKLPWDKESLLILQKEIARLRSIAMGHYGITGTLPVTKFRKRSKRGVFRCAAGEDRMTLAPDGTLWGCHIFPTFFKGMEGTDLFRKYCFGHVDDFISNHRDVYHEKLENYSDLRMDFFWSENRHCLLCDDLYDCRVCPIDAALASSSIGKIPGWVCEINSIWKKERQLFLNEVNEKN